MSAPLLGQSVLKRKNKVSFDVTDDLSQNFWMKKAAVASEFQEAFIARTKEARLRTGMTQEEMAVLLGVKQDTYKQWETRSPLPHRYVAAFCLAARISEKWLFGGRHQREAAE